MAGFPHIERYRVELGELIIAFGGSDNELNIKSGVSELPVGLLP